MESRYTFGEISFGWIRKRSDNYHSGVGMGRHGHTGSDNKLPDINGENKLVVSCEVTVPWGARQ